MEVVLGWKAWVRAETVSGNWMEKERTRPLTTMCSNSSLTLSACYGAPPLKDRGQPCAETSQQEPAPGRHLSAFRLPLWRTRYPDADLVSCKHRQKRCCSLCFWASSEHGASRLVNVFNLVHKLFDRSICFVGDVCVRLPGDVQMMWNWCLAGSDGKHPDWCGHSITI